MSPARGTRCAPSLALGMACALALVAAPFARAQTPPAPAQAPPAPPGQAPPAPPGQAPSAPPAPAAVDSLSLYLKSLGDSTDVGYGTASVAFDTTGLDSLAEGALDHPPAFPHRRAHGLVPTPISRFHRAEGWVLGLRTRVGSPSAGWLGLAGAYGFGDHLGRYAFDWRRTLFSHVPLVRARRGAPATLGEGVTRLDLVLRYERSTVPFMPEHSAMGLSTLGAWAAGTDRQSVYEMRGATALLTLWKGDLRLDLGVRHADEEAMPLVTRWSLVGDRAGVVPNVLAAHDHYTEPLGSVAFGRDDWQLAGALDARLGGGERRRLHAVLGKGLRLGRSAKAIVQLEGDAVPANAAPQRRLELGGALALPSLPLGTGDTDHLLLGKLELVGSGDVLRAVGVHPPDWLILQPLAFAQAGAAWDDIGGRDAVFVRVPRQAWRGSAGGGVAYRLGFPDTATLAKLFVAWPVGHDAGVVRVNLVVGTTFDLVGRR